MFSPSPHTRAFLPYPEPAAGTVAHAPHGPLSAYSFAVKDLFDVAGYPTGAGNPHVLVRSGIKAKHAPVVAALLEAGATFVGKTVTDEMAFSAIGNNAHFGAPINGAAPERITGGSSSGSASAVSNGQCDFALGSDTGGSVRGPASHCGLYGIRPTQYRLTLEGCFPLCATFDTCGFFARDAATFQAFADVLFADDVKPLPAKPRVLIAEDLFELLAPEVRAAFEPGIREIEAQWGKATPVRAAGDDKDALGALYLAYRELQGWEAWQTQGERIQHDGLCLGPDVAARFAYGSAITTEQVARDNRVREAFTAYITALLGDDAILILPTMPDIAPLRSTPASDIEAYRNTATHLLGLTPMCGMPQVSMPFAGREGAPLGLSLMGPAGTDKSLIARIAELTVPATAVRAPSAATSFAEPVAAPAYVQTDAKAAGEPEVLGSLGWYAQKMAGAPIQAEDLRNVAELAQAVAQQVDGTAARDLHWTQTAQGFAPALRAAAVSRPALSKTDTRTDTRTDTSPVASAESITKPVSESSSQTTSRYPLFKSLSDIGDKLQRGELRAEDVASDVLKQIDKSANSGFVRTRGAQALADARARDVAFTSKRAGEGTNGATVGLLHGIPFARKDMYFRNDDLCECGSQILAGHQPSITATVISRLEAAGGVDLGALHMAEFAMSPMGLNSHLGDGRNAWTDEVPHVSGGSSSGSGIAVAQRLAAGALGSDTGGSIRIPAAINGVTGIKPTNYLVSTHGVMPLSPSLDCVGFLAQTAQDCARLLSAVVAPDPLDSDCIATETVDYEAGIQEPLHAGIRVAIPKLEAGDLLSEEVLALVRAAAHELEAAGATLVEVELPDLAELGSLANVISMTEAAVMHREWLNERAEEYGPQVRCRIERGLLYSGAQYVEAMRLRGPMLQRFLEQAMPDADAVLLPILPHAVPSVEESLMGTEAEVEARFGRFSYWTRAVNYLGLPALALPVGFTANGLPNGVQLIARPLAEATLFRIGHQYQMRTDWHRRAPKATAAY